MLNVGTVLVTFAGLLHFQSLGSNFYLFLKGNNEIFPWIGILRVKSENYKREAVTRLVLIEKRLAVANANDIAIIRNSTLRTHTKAMFYTHNEPWTCDISNYILHPEYYNNTLNTLALLNLDCDREDQYWNPITWPKMSNIRGTVYSVGISDSHGRVHQISYKMDPVNNGTCADFYKKEKLDYELFEPKHCVCYKESNSFKQCIVEPGMALAVKSNDTRILIGLSTHGPGCSLPSRFIKFYPYITWIKTYLSAPKRNGENYRRNYEHEQGMEEPYEDLDKLILSKIDSNTIVMRPSLAYVKEQVYGKCDAIDGVLMYREYGTIKAPGDTAVGIYSVSLYDLFYSNITCVMVTVMCNQRSRTRFWFSSGFHQEDVTDYVKIISVPKIGKTKEPKVLYLKDINRNYWRMPTANLYFKFQFTDVAKMDLEFYGRNDTTPTTTHKPPFQKVLPKSTKAIKRPRLRIIQDDESSVEDDDSFYSL